MATIKLHLQTARRVKCGHPINLLIHHKSKHGTIRTGICAEKSEWEHDHKIGKSPIIKLENIKLHGLLTDAQRILLRNPELLELDCAALCRELNYRLFPDKHGMLMKREKSRSAKNGVLSVLRRFINTKQNKGTQSVYRQTERKLLEYLGEKECAQIRFEDITRGWLMEFEAHLAKTACKNARNIHLRNLRAIFNFAIDEEITTCYPFRRFKVRDEPTRKRSLTIEQLCELWEYPVEDHQQKYLDLFKLSFLLMGINLTDLLHLQHTDLNGSTLTYKRAKTGHLYEIEVAPEALALLRKYKGKKYLLNFLDERSDYETFRSRTARELGKIGTYRKEGRGGKKIYTPLVPGLSMYWARHTWATLAFNLDIPKETIAAALGHGGNSVTDIYIKIDRKKVDTANRLVIDFLHKQLQTNKKSKN